MGCDVGWSYSTSENCQAVESSGICAYITGLVVISQTPVWKSQRDTLLLLMFNARTLRFSLISRTTGGD